MKFTSLMFAALVAWTVILSPVAAADATLYQRLGGYDAVAAVSDEFLARLEADESLGRFFTGFSTDSKQRIRQHVVDLVCAATGGPCAYTGRGMKTAHAGSGISKADWDRAGEIFVGVLATFKVGESETNELLAIIGPMESDIVDSSG